MCSPYWWLDQPSASAGASISVSAMVDRDDLDHVPFIVDPINIADLTGPRGPRALEFESEG